MRPPDDAFVVISGGREALFNPDTQGPLFASLAAARRGIADEIDEAAERYDHELRAEDFAIYAIRRVQQ